MLIKAMSPNLSVAGQITAADLKEIAAAGFRSLICNRPDLEGGPEQPSFANIATAAQAIGLQVRYVPVVSGQINDSDIRDFLSASAELPKPILAYCRSGARSANLWALGEQALAQQAGGRATR